MSIFTKDEIVTNHRTGEQGKFIAQWFNEFSQQWIATVRLTSGMKASWVIAGGAA